MCVNVLVYESELAQAEEEKVAEMSLNYDLKKVDLSKLQFVQSISITGLHCGKMLWLVTAQRRVRSASSWCSSPLRLAGLVSAD